MDFLLFECVLVLLVLNHFYSSHEVKLLSPQRISSFEIAIDGEETLLAGLGLKNLCRHSETETGHLHTFFAMSELIFLANSSMRSFIRWIVHRLLDRLDFAEFRILSG